MKHIHGNVAVVTPATIDKAKALALVAHKLLASNKK